VFSVVVAECLPRHSTKVPIVWMYGFLNPRLSAKKMERSRQQPNNFVSCAEPDGQDFENSMGIVNHCSFRHLGRGNDTRYNTL